MSKMAALSAMAGKAQGAMGAAGGAVSGALGSAGTAVTQTGVYQGAAANAAKSVGLDNYGQIGIIMFFGFFYLVIAALIDMFNKCTEQR